MVDYFGSFPHYTHRCCSHHVVEKEEKWLVLYHMNHMFNFLTNR